MILEASLNYRIGSVFDTIAKTCWARLERGKRHLYCLCAPDLRLLHWRAARFRTMPAGVYRRMCAGTSSRFSVSRRWWYALSVEYQR